MSGIKANGSWTLYKILRILSISVKVEFPRKDTSKAGTIAIDLVMKTLW